MKYSVGRGKEGGWEEDSVVKARSALHTTRV